MLSKAEKFYVEWHAGVPASQLANDLGVPLRSVTAYLKKVKIVIVESDASKVEAEANPPTKPAFIQVSGFIGCEKGAAIMTQGQSETGDMFLGSNPHLPNQPRNKQFFDRYKDGVHKIFPDKP